MGVWGTPTCHIFNDLYDVIMARGLQPPTKTYHVIYDVANDNDCFVKVNKVCLLSSTPHLFPYTTCVLVHIYARAGLQIKFGISYGYLLSVFE